MTELMRILDAVDVQPPAAFRCAGRTVEAKPGRLLETLKEFLYEHSYAREFDGSFPEANGAGASEPDIIARLRAAHVGRSCRETAWIVTQMVADGQIVARKGHVVRRFGPGHYLNLDSGVGLPQKDHHVAVCRPRESTVLQPPWYHVFGETVGECEENEDLIRFYWNVNEEGGPELLGLLTRILDRFQIPFQFKIPAWKDGYNRRDAGVLYANRRYFHLLAMLLMDVHARIAPRLDPQTPLFTRKVADGLGFAEDPGDSFGSSRCEILAQALTNAAEKGVATTDGKLEELNAEFRRCGLSLERPWLNAPLVDGAVRDYDFPAVCA